MGAVGAGLVHLGCTEKSPGGHSEISRMSSTSRDSHLIGRLRYFESSLGESSVQPRLRSTANRA